MQGPRWERELAARRAAWVHRGASRPDFAEEPGPGGESVWDYPRPPRVEPELREVVVSLEGVEVARSDAALRVLETGSPPTIYLPPAHVRPDVLRMAGSRSVCEWKGVAEALHVDTGTTRAEFSAWTYPEPFPGFESIAGYVSFYPRLLDCRLGGERVRPQHGEFYGGWVTDEIAGPWKGEPGTGGW